MTNQEPASRQTGTEPHRFAGTYERYPDLTGGRRAEGGRRLRGEVRESLPDQPLVTIITVCFNSADTIEQTIRSVRGQSYGNVEYVVVDGGSTDRTVDILRESEDVIDYFVSEPDAGLYFAMNKGIELAQGELILILNSDDWFAQDAVETLVAAKDYSGCDFVGALARYIDEKTGKVEVLRSMPFDDSVHFRMSLRHETMLVPAWLYDKVGPYDTDYRIIADRALTARIFDAEATYYEVPRDLLNFRTSGVSNTDTDGLNREREMLLAQVFPFLTPGEVTRLSDRKATAAIYADIANAHLDQPEFVKAVRALLQDRRQNGGRAWQSNAGERIGASDPLNWPKVSVILPYYEAEDTIAASLESVLGQSLEEFEIVCVNDCAIDNSQAVVERYAARDARVKMVRNARNMGLGASRNAGIRAARGRYVFHLDPDDTIPANALENLYNAAATHRSEMTKGAYRAGQSAHNQTTRVVTKYPCDVRDRVVANTSLKDTPALMRTTEGHWSYLYEANFARRVPYPTDLKMGQDSIFLVNAVARATRVTLVPEVIYNYEVNTKSAMNKFTARKFFDGLEWRRRAWHVLRDMGYPDASDYMLFAFWNPAMFGDLDATMTEDERTAYYTRLAGLLYEAGYPGDHPPKNAKLKDQFKSVLRDYAPDAFDDSALRIATLSTQDHGGAGIGSLRRVEALRRHGVNAEVFCLFKKTNLPHVRALTPRQDLRPAELRRAWREAAVVTREDSPGKTAMEMFSRPGSMVDLLDNREVFDRADIVHLHWVAGVLDYEHFEEVLGDKPVAWTLADMNAFTGGCHYSEGCEGYKSECEDCPLVGVNTEIAHETWKTKRAAYEKIKNLHVICPSQWLADCARQSKLFGDRPVHMIPNAIPVDRFSPTNRVVARQKLGLPLKPKLVLFGAESLENRRKGGDILADAIRILKSRGQAKGVQGLFFGDKSLKLGIETHSMGQVKDEQKMALIYAAADVFAFPSRGDNAPLTVVESLLAGTPVVGFPVGNVPEMVEHKRTGYIARYEDTEDFADGLAWALKSSSTTHTVIEGMRGYLHARAHNDPDTAAKRHIALYREMAPEAADKFPYGAKKS